MKFGVALGAVHHKAFLDVALEADKLGYESVWLPEHLGDEWGPELQARYGDQPVGSMATFEEADAARREAGVEVAVAIGLTSTHLHMSIPNEFIAEYVERGDGTTVGFASVEEIATLNILHATGLAMRRAGLLFDEIRNAVGDY